MSRIPTWALASLLLGCGAGGPAVSPGEHDGGAGFDLLHAVDLDQPGVDPLVQEPAQIRILPSGRVVLFDAREQRILLLNENLTLHRAVGRRGSGPGEFRALAAVVPLPGDSLLAATRVSPQVTVFMADGSMARTFAWPQVREAASMPLPMGGQVPLPIPIGVSDDGRIVVSIPTLMAPEGERARRLIYVGPPDAVPLILLADVPHTLAFVEGRARWGNVLYSPEALVAVRGHRVYIGVTDSAHLHIHDLRNGSVHQVSHGLNIGRITEADVAAARLRRLDEPSIIPPFATEAIAMLKAAIERAPPADRHPAYTGMIVDPEERIWLVSCEPLDPGRCRATILGQSGDRLGQFALPTGFVLHDVGRRGIVGVTDHQDQRGRVIEYRSLPRELR